MKRQTPPLDAIEAFLAAAQAPSFREAADALAISPSAFSRRIQALESFLGAALFDRSAPRPVLNEAAAAGLGLAIAVPFLADRALASGRLRRIGLASAPLGVGYYLVCASPKARRRPDVQAFCAWAHAEAEATLAAFDALG